MTVFGFVIIGVAAILLVRSLFRKSVSLFGLTLLLAGLLIEVITVLVK